MGVKRPVLLDNQLRERSILYPTKASLTLNMTGPSECSLTLPKDAPRIDMHGWVKIFNQNGFVGIFRRTSSSHNAPLDVTVQLRHGIDILQDSLWQEETEFTGSTGEFITAILNHQTALVNGQKPWVLDSCADTTQIEEKKISYNNLWDLLRSLEDESGDYYFTYDQSTFPWRLSYVKKNSTPMSEFRLSRNLSRIRINENDSELCTRLILNVNEMQTVSEEFGDREANQSTKQVYDNTAAQAVYGIIAKTTDIDLKDHPEGAAAFAQRFLNSRAAPVLQIQADGYDLKAVTGFDWDEQHIGRMCRVALPDYDTWFTERVVSVQYPNLLDQPSVISVSLANALPKLSHSASQAARQADSNAAASRELEREQATTSSSANLNLIRSGYVDDVFKQAGLVIDPTGVLIFAKSGLFDEKFAQIDVREDHIESTVRDVEANTESKIREEADKITLMVHTLDDTLSGKITQTAESLTSDYTNKITQTEGKITQTAESLTSDYTKMIGDTEAALQGKITQTAESLTSDYTDKINGVSSHITQTASEIRSEVEDEVSGLSSSIQQNADSIALNAKNIKIIADDYVTINRLQTELASLTYLEGKHISVASATVAGVINAGGLSVGNLDIGTHSHALTFADGELVIGNPQAERGSAAIGSVHSISIDGTKVADFIGTADVNFDKAAAKAEGAAAVRLTSQGWQSGGRNIVKATYGGSDTGQSYTVNLPAFSTSGGDSFSSHKTTVYFSTSSVDGPLASKEVDASSEYNAGSTAGANGVTLSKGNWSSGVTRVTASNGKTVDVSLPSFSVSGGDSFGSDHKTTVYFSTPSVDGALKSKTVDASGQYSSGVSAGKSGVTLSVGSWSNGKVTVTASNDKTATVSLPSFSVSGGDSFDSNHQTTVYFSTSSVSGALKSKTVDATGVYNAGRGQGMSEYYSSGHWAKPSSSNSWTCYVPSQYNSSAEVWFSLADILPTPSYTWTNPAKGYAQVEFYICGKYYHTAKQIPGGWM